MHRNIIRLAVYVIAGLILAGCATTGPHKQPSGTTTEAEHADIVATPEHSPWQPIPNPDDDLWVKVRNGYRLPAQTGHASIRQWVQFYLDDDKHLHASIRRAQPFLWHVVQALHKRDMPMELALLPIVESGYNADALSYAGAGGLWQFMPPTASDMGLRQNWWYDGRYDVIASTKAALQYLAWLHDYFNDNWLLAIAAYNAGPGRIDEALDDAHARGVPADFWHLDLSAETTAYVPKLLALRRLLAEPSKYGLLWPSLSDQPRTARVTLPSQIEVDIAADMLGIPETTLRTLNPDIRHTATDPDNSAAALLVPIDKAAAFRVALADADPNQLVTRQWYRVRHGDSLSRIAHTHGVTVAALRRANDIHGSRIIRGQRLLIPRHGAPQAAPPTRPYVVKRGDTLWQIAHRNGISVAALQRSNHLRGDALSPGETLKLPATAEPTTYRVAAGDTLWDIAHRYDVSIADIRRWNRLDKNAVLQPGQTLAISGEAPLPDFYMVQDGDTLWAIAQRFGIQVALLRNINSINNPNSLQPGQRLRLQPAG